MKSRVFATLAVISVLAIGVSTPAFASQSYTGALSANSAAPGGSVQYSSDDTGEPGGTPGSYSLSESQSGALGAAAINLAADITHSVRVGSHSQLLFTVKLPSDAKPGSTYTLSVRAGSFSDTQPITIIGVAGSAAPANLTPLWIVLVLALLIVLAVIFFVARRRRNSAQDTTTA